MELVTKPSPTEHILQMEMWLPPDKISHSASHKEMIISYDVMPNNLHYNAIILIQYYQLVLRYRLSGMKTVWS
jgi:hypothetical protein